MDTVFSTPFFLFILLAALILLSFTFCPLYQWGEVEWERGYCFHITRHFQSKLTAKSS